MAPSDSDPTERNAPSVEAAFQAVPSELIAEILDGELHISPHPARPQLNAMSNLVPLLGMPFMFGKGGPGGWVILHLPELHLGPRPDKLVPALAGWTREHLPDAVGGEDTPAQFDLAPDWVCEKMRIYAHEGVRHVWQVDPRARTLDIFRLQEGRWLLVHSFAREERVRAEPFDAVTQESIGAGATSNNVVNLLNTTGRRCDSRGRAHLLPRAHLGEAARWVRGRLWRMEPPEPTSPPSLSQLVARVRSPDAGIAEVDALLRGLDQPPRPREDADERAELLQRLLDDPFLRSLTGSDGRRVHAVAARAMVALGPPYSLELAPEHLAAMRPARRAASRPRVHHDEAPKPSPEDSEPSPEAPELPPIEVSLRQKVGRLFVMALGAIELYIGLVYLDTMQGKEGSTSGLLARAMVALVTAFGPALVATSQEGMRIRALHYLCLALVLLPCLHWGMYASAALVFTLLGSTRPETWLNVWIVTPLALALARLVGGLCLYGRPPEARYEAGH